MGVSEDQCLLKVSFDAREELLLLSVCSAMILDFAHLVDLEIQCGVKMIFSEPLGNTSALNLLLNGISQWNCLRVFSSS